MARCSRASRQNEQSPSRGRLDRLRDGSGEGRVPLRLLELVAEYSGVEVGYLAGLSNSDVADATEAQLELRDAIRA